MKYRFLANFFFLVGLGFLGLAAYSYFGPEPGSGLEVAQTDIRLDHCPAGKETTVVYHLDNKSGRPMRVLGLAGCWSLNCRFGRKRSDDLEELPPGPSDLECSLQTYRPGPFNSQLTLFVDDQGTRDIVLTVSGMAEKAQPRKD